MRVFFWILIRHCSHDIVKGAAGHCNSWQHQFQLRVPHTCGSLRDVTVNACTGKTVAFAMRCGPVPSFLRGGRRMIGSLQDEYAINPSKNRQNILRFNIIL